MTSWVSGEPEDLFALVVTDGTQVAAVSDSWWWPGDELWDTRDGTRRSERYSDPMMTASELTEGLRKARAVQMAMFGDLEGEQLLGTPRHHLEPPIWEMGHVAWFQELWILRHLANNEPFEPCFDGVYDSFNVSYRLRWDHKFPSRDETLQYAQTILDRCVGRLAGRDPTEADDYFYQLAVFHENMHSENLLAARQTLGYPHPTDLHYREPPVIESDYQPRDISIGGSLFFLGASRDGGFVFDNEKWAHPVEVAPFRIASVPVTNEQYRQFVDDGAYQDRSLWTKRGWQWRRKEGAEHPLFWERRGSQWYERRFDEVVDLRPWHPICFVNWHEARAYCRYASRRLPTEVEWEMAASWDPDRGVRLRYPWGDSPPSANLANLGCANRGTVDVRSLGAGDSPCGCRQMIGNIWEWTDSKLEPFPGFTPDPYAEYSQPYFGQKPVLRGGCWGTSPGLIRNTWRNFFVRHRRNIFAGFRTCAL